MSAEDLAVVGNGGDLLLAGWYVQTVATLVERYVDAARSGCARVDGRIAALLEASRIAVARGCATQPAQPLDVGEAPWWPPDDEIDVQEAAEIMDCSRTNVRKRAGSESLPGVKIGGRWVLSRTAVLAAALERGAR